MQTTDATEHADQYGAKLDKYNDAVTAAEAATKRGFLELCNGGSAESLDAFAPSHTYLDYNGGPLTVNLIQIVLDLANKRNVNDLFLIATELIEKMATSFSDYNTDLTNIEY